MIRFFDHIDDENRIYRMIIEAANVARTIADAGGTPTATKADAFSEGMIGFNVFDANQSLQDQDIVEFRASIHAVHQDFQTSDGSYGEWDAQMMAPLRQALQSKDGRTSIARAINRIATGSEVITGGSVARMVKRVYNIDQDLDHLFPSNN